MNTSVSWNDFDALYDNTSKKKTIINVRRLTRPYLLLKSAKKDIPIAFFTCITTVTEEDVPDIMEAGPEPSTTTKRASNGRNTFFNKKNSDFWQRDDLSHLRPYDFPYIRIVTAATSDTLSPEDTRHKEQARSSIEVVTRAYEEKFLREPIGEERACVMNENCQGNQLPHITDNKFTLREFLLPSEDGSTDELVNGLKKEDYVFYANVPK